MQRLGKNLGAYHGETIDIASVLREAESAAQAGGWLAETFHETQDFRWQAFRRKARGQAASRLYLSTGIHGDEPAGPLAALRLLRENRWPENAEIFLLPCLNPTGFAANRRENPGGKDLNRDYLGKETEEVRAHVAWLERQGMFDVYVCLHEDWESEGFYLYEQNPDGRRSLADDIVAAVTRVCPIDGSAQIEGRAASGGIIRPNVRPADRPDWPEAFYLIAHKSRLGYTLEAPSDFPLATRVDALVAGVRAVLDHF